MPGRYFEDFAVGDEIATYGWTVTESAIIDFAAAYDPQPFHLDTQAAARSPYGGLIASGFQTLSVGFRLFVATGVLAETGLGSPGIDEVRWLRPVYAGDTLRTIVRILEARASESKPDRGIVRALYRILNHRDEDVASFTGIVLVKRRQP